MPFTKAIGPLTLSESGGVATISITQAQVAGGGDVEGFMGYNVTANAHIDVKVLVDAGLELIESKFPAFATEIAALKGLIDAEISKA